MKSMINRAQLLCSKTSEYNERGKYMAHSEVTAKDTWTTLLIYRFQVFGSIHPVMCQEYNIKGIWYLLMNQRIKA